MGLVNQRTIYSYYVYKCAGHVLGAFYYLK